MQEQADAPAYDTRKLLKITVADGFSPDDIEFIPGVELISQEDKTILLAFGDEDGLANFESRLATLVRGERPVRKEVLYAIQQFAPWTEDDRTGPALRVHGWPQTETFIVDVELWPLVRGPERRQIRDAFEIWLAENGIAQLDYIDQPSLLIYRIRTDREIAPLLLGHRDVRMVDLKPSFHLDAGVILTDINNFPPLQAPEQNGALVGVLDSGLATGHPLIGAAVGEAAGFLPPDREASDECGHGTMVAGLVLYGDVESCIERGGFLPEARVLSGRILDENNENNTGFIEKQIDEAVRYFHTTYDCRIFNLCYGDLNKVYQGGHLRGLAYTLDQLARELGILFIVPTGNFREDDVAFPEDPRTTYPRYLSQEAARLLDPATALNVLTVGSLARRDLDFQARRNPETLESLPIARRDQPSPFTRRGPTVGDAIKPELVEYGGNLAVRRTGGRLVRKGLGEVSMSIGFAGGNAFSEDVGTSFAAPHVTNVAARLLNAMPDASANLLRALMVAHARVPTASTVLFEEDKDALRNLCGYGRIDRAELFRSSEHAVTMYAETSIANQRHHFYEVPIPESFWLRGARDRQITVTLAYTPAVRTTRIDYRATRITFQLVRADSLEQVVQMFNRATPSSEHRNLPEYSTNRDNTADIRSRGTVQKSTWRLRTVTNLQRQKKYFVVVTRLDRPWAEPWVIDEEPYALVISLWDRENAQAQLFTQIQARMQGRARERARIRQG